MKYTETLPSKKVSDIVLNYWTFEIPESKNETGPFVHELLPENTVSVVFIYDPYFKAIRLLGPQLKMLQQEVNPGSFYLGIRFNPWIKMESITGDKKSIVNQTAPVPDFLVDVFREINIPSLIHGFSDFPLLETGLTRLMTNNQVLTDPLVKYICLQLLTEIKIKDLVKDIPMSIRPIQTYFKSITGISMSTYRSIHRLQNTVKTIYLENDSISSASFKHNYTDHSHFMNTFKKYMNTSVKNFLLNADNIELSIEK